MVWEAHYRGGIGGWGRDEGSLRGRVPLRAVVGVGFGAPERGGRVLPGKDLAAEFVGKGAGCGAGLSVGGWRMGTWDREGLAVEAEKGG